MEGRPFEVQPILLHISATNLPLSKRVSLARAFVRSTEDAATQLWHRHRLAEIEAEDDPNIKIILDGSIEVDDVVVEARVELGSGKTLSGRATISMSTNFDRHRPASVAKGAKH